MLHLYHSNRLERLFDKLAETLDQPLQDPLAQESVVVQHPGMGRWLSLQLSERFGICANMDFPLPAAYIWRLLRQLLDDVPHQDDYQPVMMQWWLFDRLQRELPGACFAPVRRYLSGADEVMRFQLAGEIARVFDHYLVYRPDWIEAWQESRQAVPGDSWQAILWREFRKTQSNPHWSELLRRLANGEGQPDRLPQRVALFGLASLSPGYLQILVFASRWMDIHLYLLNPAQGLWMDLVSERELQRRIQNQTSDGLYLETGHPLLTSLGGQGRDFYNLLLSYDPGSEELFDTPDGASLLTQLQRDILTPEAINDPILVQAHDRSIEIHSCHSPMRELEVLHDQLLHRLQEDPTLQPRQILVMTPDMDRYAPYIEAVFGESANETAIPYTLSDRSQWLESPLINHFFKLLGVVGGRYPADEVMSLMESPALLRRFGLTPEDLERVRRWVEQVAIRWGREGTRKATDGQPLCTQNSWQVGLDRLLLGYALNEEDRLYRGILPSPEVEGSEARILGAVYDFVTALFGLEAWLLVETTPGAWGHRLNTTIDRFLLADEEEQPQLQALRSAIARFVELAEAAGVQGGISRDLVMDQLREQLSKPITARFLGGGVNFCALTPMRSLPFRVVCLIGMNDGVFPARDRDPGFDLLQYAEPRLGDRSRRADDRYLFLETLISAREQLYISYLGQDVRDNTVLPPSVLVSELLDTMDSAFVGPDGQPPSSWLLVKHPLQPFSPAYYRSDGHLFSYSELYCAGANQRLTATAEQSRLVPDQLPPANPEWQQIEVSQLLRFVQHPTRYLLTNRLNMTLVNDQAEMESREPFELDYFAQSDLFERQVEGYLKGRPRDEIDALERARGVLPHGVVGDVMLGRLNDSALGLLPRLRQFKAGAGQEQSLPVDIRVGALRLSGRLDRITEGGLIGYSLHRLPASRLLQMWVRHLLLNILAPSGVTLASRWLSAGAELTLAPVTSPERHLAEILELYWRGLHEPLPLFPKSSRRYAELLVSGKPEEYALDKARECWFGGFSQYAEFDDAYYRLAFGNGDVLDEDFTTLSRQVFDPLLSVMEEV